MRRADLVMAVCLAGVLGVGCAKQPANVATAGTPTAEQIHSGEITGPITVSCYETAMYQTFLEEAARQFEQKYPGTQVNIESFSEMPQTNTSEQDGQERQAIIQEDNPQGRADYISKTSTSLMSGQGADLLAMDVLPVYKYAEAGQLENLQEYMDTDPEFKKSDYRENILSALGFRDGVWFLPMNYSFDYYAYDSSIAGKESGFGINKVYNTMQLAELGKSVFDGTNKLFPAPAYLKSGNGDMFSRLFEENYKSYVDMENGEAKFNDGKFKTMIEDIKGLADDGYINQAVSQTSDASEMLKSMSEDPTERFMYKPKNQFSLVEQTHPDPEFQMTVSTSEVGNGIESDDEIVGIRADGDGIVPFSYDQAFGLNSNSSNKVTAWAFLKFLMSYEVQVSPNMSVISLPIHNQARLDRTENLYRMMMAEGGELDDTQALALDGYINAVESMSAQMNGYTYVDTTIRDMVIKEMAYFFDGSKSSDQVCEVLQNKVELYLNE